MKLSKEHIAMIVGCLTTIGSFLGYAETRVDKIKEEAKQEMNQQIDTLQKRIDDERQERQVSVDQINKKLDTIINILATRRGHS